VVGIKETLRHLKDGKPLGIFPAGEVSTYKDGKLMVDKPWEEGAIKVIRKAQVPVVPIYFHAKNSKLFYFLSKIDDTLRTAKLPSELLTQKDRVIKVRIGKPISVAEQNEYQNKSNLIKLDVPVTSCFEGVPYSNKHKTHKHSLYLIYVFSSPSIRN